MNREKWTKKEFIFLFFITAVAAFLRLYQLDKIPPGLHGDEAWTGLDAQRILQEGWIGPYVGSGLGQPTGSLYWTALIFKVFGINLFTLRASMALLGILTIPALYFLAKRLFDRRVAVFAAFFLTFSFWHLHFSRIGFMLISVPLIECLVLIFLFRALQTKSKLNWIIAGALAGLGVYSYNTYPMFLLTIGLTLYFIFLQAENKRKLLTPLFTFLVSFLLFSLPLVSFIFDSKNNFFAHHETIFVLNDLGYQQTETVSGKVQFFLKKIFKVATIFHKSYGFDYGDALGERPLLDNLTGIFFISGVLMSLRKIKDRRYFPLFLGLATAFPVVLSIGGATRRIITVLPFVFILAALPVVKLWQWRWGKMVTAAVCLFIVLFNSNYYFNDLRSTPMTKWFFCYDLVQATNYLKTFSSDSTYIYFYSNRWSYNFETRRFLLPNTPGESRSKEFGPPEADSEFSIERKHNQGVIYLLMPPYENLIDEIQRKYPNGKYQEFHDEDGRLMFVSYYLPPIL